MASGNNFREVVGLISASSSARRDTQNQRETDGETVSITKRGEVPSVMVSGTAVGKHHTHARGYFCEHACLRWRPDTIGRNQWLFLVDACNNHCDSLCALGSFRETRNQNIGDEFWKHAGIGIRQGSSIRDFWPTFNSRTVILIRNTQLLKYYHAIVWRGQKRSLNQGPLWALNKSCQKRRISKIQQDLLDTRFQSFALFSFR